MNLKQLKQLVKQGESETIEFKRSTGQLRAAFETVYAFLNNNGGIILFGIANDGKILGQQIGDKTRQEIAEEISKLEPSAQAQLDVGYLPVTKEKYVIALKVKKGNHVPYQHDNRAFQRNQSTTIRMSQHLYEQLIVARGQLEHSWESIVVPKFSIKDLDGVLIKNIVRQAVNKNRLDADITTDNVKDILDKFYLLKDGKPTRAAVILFGKETGRRFIQSQLRLARFRGTDDDEFIDNKIYIGNAFYLYEQAINFLNNFLPISGRIIEETPARIDTPAIPGKVLRESIVNALIHRDYSIHGGAVNIAIYDNRVEINSAGALPKGMNKEKLISKHRSYPRNPLIAKIFYIAGYIEMWGRGIAKIIELSKAAGNPKPEFEITDTDFTICLPLKEPILSAAKPNSQANLEADLNARQKEILEIIKRHSIMNIQQIMAELENPPSVRMVKKELVYLKERGFIELKGAARSSVWVLK